MARPPREKEPSRTRSQRWTDAEWAQVQRQAKRAGYSTSDYIRELVFTHGAVQNRAAQRARARRKRPEPAGVAFARESIERATAPAGSVARNSTAPAAAATQTRDLGSGQYAHAFETMCVCGHSVGEHTAASVGGRRDCLADGCSCMKVRKVRPKRSGAKRKPYAHELAHHAPPAADDAPIS